jgi:hypothetical protein
LLRQKNRGLVSHFSTKVVSSALVDYLIDLATLLKDKAGIRQKIQNFFLTVLTNGYDTSSVVLERLPEMLV